MATYRNPNQPTDWGGYSQPIQEGSPWAQLHPPIATKGPMLDDPSQPWPGSGGVPGPQPPPSFPAPVQPPQGPVGISPGPMNYQDQSPDSGGGDYNTGTNGVAPVAPPAAPPAAPTGDWIDMALQNAKSTDDPNYWHSVIAQHGDTNNASAQDYWIQRIMQGDGSEGVRNGTTQKFQDSSGGSPLDDILKNLQGGDPTGPDTNWNGTGGTEADWRKKYPIPGAGPDGMTAPGPTLDGNPTAKPKSLDDYIQEILSSGGNYNQPMVDRQIGSARDTLERFKTSQMDSQHADLADRGLMGSGEETNASNTLSNNLGSQFGQSVSDITSGEMQRADARMMQALTLGAGLDTSRAQQVIDQFNAETGRESSNNALTLGEGNIDLQRQLGLGRLDLDKLLGMGNLDLQKTLGLGQLGIQSTGQQLDWSKFLSQFGLDREKFAYDQEHGGNQDLLTLLQQILGGAGQAGSGTTGGKT